MQRRATAVKLLFETLENAERAAKTQYLEPVLQILRPQVSEFFPGSQLILDAKSIEITQLERNGVSEDYTDLSVGTREQLSDPAGYCPALEAKGTAKRGGA